MAVLSMLVDVKCQTCGADLGAYGTSNVGDRASMRVIPCQTCLNRAENHGWISGYEKRGADQLDEKVPA